MVHERFLVLAAAIQFNIDALVAEFDFSQRYHTARLYRSSVLLQLLLQFGLIDHAAVGPLDAVTAKRQINPNCRFFRDEFTYYVRLRLFGGLRQSGERKREAQNYKANS